MTPAPDVRALGLFALGLFAPDTSAPDASSPDALAPDESAASEFFLRLKMSAVSGSKAISRARIL